MPRRVAVTLCLVLFTIAMPIVRAVLHATVPSIIASLDATIGEAGSAALIAGAGIAMAIAAIRPYRAEARNRSELRR